MEQALRMRLELSRSRVNDIVTNAQGLLRQVEEDGVDPADLSRTKLELREATPKLREEIQNYMGKVENFSMELVRDCTELELKADQTVVEVIHLLAETQRNSNEDSSRHSVVKLPKLQLPTFEGDILKWHDFWDHFKASVHSAPYSNAAKMTFLASSLKGRALEAIEGLGSTDKNYPIAIETLKRRYGNTRYMIDAHYDALRELGRAKDTPSDCRRVLNSVEKNIRVLESLGEDGNSNAFRSTLLNKFPERVVFQLNIGSKGGCTVREMREHLDNIITAMEMSRVQSHTSTSENPAFTTEALQVRAYPSMRANKGNGSQYKAKGSYTDSLKHGPSREYKQPIKRKLPSNSSIAEKRARRPCIFCDGGHNDDECDTITTRDERFKKLAGKCFKCFGEGHVSKNCATKVVCSHCSGLHRSALCRNKPSGINTTNTDLLTTAYQSHNCKSLLQTATARVLSKSGTWMLCRILLDSGSQRSYITERLAKILSIKPNKEDRLMIYTFGSEKPIETMSPSIQISIETKRGMQKEFEVNIVPSITDRIPVANVSSSDLIDVIADDGSCAERIDVLIGNDYYFSCIIGRMIKVNSDLYLADTVFGWITSGKVEISDEKDTLAVVTYHQSYPGYTYFTEPDLPLRNMDIKFMWTLENLGITDSAKTTREDEAVHHFNETVQYQEGRYFVKWPWTHYPPDLPTNYGLAYGRLKGLIHRSDLTTLQEYDDILKEQCSSKIVELVDPKQDLTRQTVPPIHYLPHHIVQQVGKRGRIVYDASARVKDQHSLNECMYRGPCMLQDLTALLLNFRINKIGITADVEKAFLQVGLQPEDRDVTRFLWVKDIRQPLSNDNIIHLRFCRVPFGIIASPFLLTATIRYHLSKTNENLLESIADKCYVDNLVTGADTTEEAERLYTEAKTTFQELSMNIRDWTSNDKSLMKKIPKQSQGKQIDRVKVLGLLWSVEEDSLQLKVNEDIFDEERISKANKRDILRTLASIYDPCGFVSPLLMPAKLLLQELWQGKYKWETKLPESLLSRWKRIVEELKDIKNVKLPRHLSQNIDLANANYEVHCFTDAGQNSYATVAYLRTEDLNGITISMLMSKTRVAPLKDKENLKIPRLELLGYLIGNRLLTYLKKMLALPNLKQFLWTDSLVVLSWIKSKKLLPPFVARRVEEIKQNTEVQRCYINTELNPADLATRPEMWTQKKELWSQGPPFLAENKGTWPKSMHLEEHLVSLSAAAESLDAVQPEVIENVPMPVDTPESELREHSDAQKITDLQSRHFPEEFKGKETHLTRNLGLFKDIDGVLRCKGRLIHADLSYETKHPILLPKDSEFTTKIIKDVHEANYHVGVPHTLSIVREQYWIPQGRVQVQKVIRRCPQCVKHGGGPYRLPETPALPVERVRYTKPFTYTGVDYFGPMYVRSGEGKEKRWICLFTCLVVRAIHLEVVQDLTAEECLLALRRFIACRGIPSYILSDNALHFKLTSEVLTSEYCSKNNINWKFIPQLAPWHGGVYERLVAVLKHCLKRTLEKHLLGGNQLLTIMKEVEAVVNTRPLTYVGADVNHILKPADFLSLGKCLDIDLSVDQLVSGGTVTKENLVEGWRKGQRLIQEFKNMFVGQYLLNLRERYRQAPRQPRVKSHDTPSVGHIVQIKGESKNRSQWKVGRISELIKGPDGEIRVAKVRVGSTDFTRSIGHLYPLEAEVECDGPICGPKVPDELSEVGTSAQIDQSTLCPINDQQAMEAESQVEELNLGGTIDLNQNPRMEVDHIEPADLNAIDASEITPQVDSNDEDQPIDVSPARDEVGVPGGRLRRDAAIRARERIAEWTRQLFSLVQF